MPIKIRENYTLEYNKECYLKDYIFCSAPPCDDKSFGSSYKTGKFGGTFVEFVSGKQTVSGFKIKDFIDTSKEHDMNYHCSEPQIIIGKLARLLPIKIC